MPECPVCNNEAEVRENPTTLTKIVDCLTCAQFEMARRAADDWPALIRDHPERVPLLSHAIRKRQREGNPPIIDLPLVIQIIEETSLPSVAQQADNLVLMMGGLCKTPEEKINGIPNS